MSGDSGGADGLGLPAFIADLAVGKQDLEIYPDTWVSVGMFRDLLTQWRMGFAGPIGLDYAAIPVVLRLRRIARESWPDIFDDIQTLESAALSVLAETREQA